MNAHDLLFGAAPDRRNTQHATASRRLSTTGRPTIKCMSRAIGGKGIQMQGIFGCNGRYTIWMLDA